MIIKYMILLKRFFHWRNIKFMKNQCSIYIIHRERFGNIIEEQSINIKNSYRLVGFLIRYKYFKYFMFILNFCLHVLQEQNKSILKNKPSHLYHRNIKQKLCILISQLQLVGCWIFLYPVQFVKMSH